ncbi:F-box/RNI-like superfamily protein [Striga asiatica]|uniref:F-box/RNI-like superfamily protein n=1 Tax=Striga asiatica TaxID=4170 RepID=A0A5A7QJS8_STRAF|nr:F-box/RNI-like superfamily protein [Striga asiatica]
MTSFCPLCKKETKVSKVPSGRAPLTLSSWENKRQPSRHALKAIGEEKKEKAKGLALESKGEVRAMAGITGSAGYFESNSLVAGKILLVKSSGCAIEGSISIISCFSVKLRRLDWAALPYLHTFAPMSCLKLPPSYFIKADFSSSSASLVERLEVSKARLNIGLSQLGVPLITDIPLRIRSEVGYWWLKLLSTSPEEPTIIESYSFEIDAFLVKVLLKKARTTLAVRERRRQSLRFDAIDDLWERKVGNLCPEVIDAPSFPRASQASMGNDCRL